MKVTNDNLGFIVRKSSNSEGTVLEFVSNKAGFCLIIDFTKKIINAYSVNSTKKEVKGII